MADCFALTTQKIHLVQQARHSVQLNQIDNIVLSCKSLMGQLELLVLVDATPAELGLAAAADQTAAVGAHSVLDQIGEIVCSKLFLALN